MGCSRNPFRICNSRRTSGPSNGNNLISQQKEDYQTEHDSDNYRRPYNVGAGAVVICPELIDIISSWQALLQKMIFYSEFSYWICFPEPHLLGGCIDCFFLFKDVAVFCY